jgi:hypothetical protein
VNKPVVIKPFVQILILFVAVSILGCKKTDKHNNSDLLGEWVSTDLADTLNFTSDRDLFKNLNGISDHYIYNITDDSIRFEYSGILMQNIYIGPSPEYVFHLTMDNLTIDFRPQYLGFRPQIVTFNRK